MANENVKTVEGLQNLLGKGVTVLTKVTKRDMEWAKQLNRYVSTGNQLIRTRISQEKNQ